MIVKTENKGIWGGFKYPEQTLILQSRCEILTVKVEASTNEAKISM